MKKLFLMLFVIISVIGYSQQKEENKIKGSLVLKEIKGFSPEVIKGIKEGKEYKKKLERAKKRDRRRKITRVERSKYVYVRHYTTYHRH